MDALAYARQLKRLLPPGSLWLLETTAKLSKLLLAIADELVRIDGRGDDLVEEWDPRTADETLEDWERVLAIVPAVGDEEATAKRQLLVATKMIAQGGQRAAYFVALAAQLGFVALVARTGTHQWTMTVDLDASTSPFAVVETVFRAGTARAGDYLTSRAIPALEDVINRAKPAHTRALFAYIGG